MFFGTRKSERVYAIKWFKLSDMIFAHKTLYFKKVEV